MIFAQSSVIKTYAAYLSAMYTRRLDSHSQWPPVQPSEYIPMMFTKILPGITNTEEKISRKAYDILAGKAKNASEPCEVVTMSTILNTSYIKDSKSVLVEGAPGIGKTAFTYMLCQMWARKKALPEFKVVIRWNISDLFSLNFEKVDDLVFHDNELVKTNVANEITSNGGKDILFVLDGWDEIPENAEEWKVELLIDLIKGKRLPVACVIVTTRSLQAGKQFRINPSFFDQCLEVNSFSDDDIHKYISKALSKAPEKAEKLIKQLFEQPDVKSLCFIPINCAIVTYVFITSKKGQKLPKTLTKFYNIFIQNILLRNLQLRMEGGKKITELQDDSVLPKQVTNLISLLSEIAFRSIWTNKYTFSGREIQSLTTIPSLVEVELDKLGILQSQQVFHCGGSSVVFHFLHSSVQQFLSAMYLSKLTVDEQSCYISQYFQYRPFSQVWKYFSGLQTSDELRKNGFICHLEEFIAEDTYEYAYRDSFSCESSLCSNHYLETLSNIDWSNHNSESSSLGNSTEPSLCDEAVLAQEPLEAAQIESGATATQKSDSVNEFLKIYNTEKHESREETNREITGPPMTTLNFKSASKFLTGVPLKLDVRRCDRVSITSKFEMNIMALKFLLTCLYEAQKPSLCSMIAKDIGGLLCLSEYKLNRSEINAVAYFLAHAGVPIHLDISSCNIQQYHLNILLHHDQQSNFSAIHKLSLQENELDASCAKVLSKMNQTLKMCEKIFLQDNEIGDEGCKYISKLISKLEKLKAIDVGSNKFTAIGLFDLINSLKLLNNISHLRFSYNSLGSEVAGALVALISQKPTLTHLEVAGIQLGNEGVKVLAAHLGEHQCHLKYLNIGNNDVSDEGAVCIATALNTNKMLEQLRIYSNPIGAEAASIFFDAISNSSPLLFIDLSNCIIYHSDALTHSIQTTMEVNTNLKKLDLSDNMLTDEGLSSIIDSLIKAGSSTPGTAMAHLVMVNTGFGRQALEALSTAFFQLKTLSSVTLSGRELLSVYFNDETTFAIFINSLTILPREIMLKFVLEDGSDEKKELKKHMTLLNDHRERQMLPKLKVYFYNAGTDDSSEFDNFDSESAESYEVIEEIVLSDEST